MVISVRAEQVGAKQVEAEQLEAEQLRADTRIDNVYKQGVAQSFGHAAAAYHRLAQLQRNCAHQLFQQLRRHLPTPPLPGPILEVGCGTGFLSAEVVQQLPDCEVVITDLSADMVAFCRSNLAAMVGDRPATVKFAVVDGENIPMPEQLYSLVISSFALQWFENPIQTLKNWLSVTLPGGWVAVAFPSNHSFPEWRSACEQSGVPYTANPLPEFQTIVAAIAPAARTCHFATTWHHSEHPNPQHFFQHLKALGTGYRRDRATLTPAQWKHLWQTWQQQIPPEQAIKVSYHTVYLLLRR